MGIKINQNSIKEDLEQTKKDLEDLENYIGEFSTFLPLPFCTLTSLGLIIDANPAFEKLTEFEALEIVGRGFEDIFLEKEKVKKIIEEIKEKGKIEEELTLISKSKRKICADISIGARRDFGGTFVGSFVGIFDITKLKKLQEELEEKIRQRTKELRERIDELEKFNKLTIGRELRMVELKEEIKNLKKAK